MRKLILVLALMVPVAVEAQETTQRIRIGVYDSRAVALAYYNRDDHFTEMKRFRAEYELARKADNQKRIAEMDLEAKTRQQIKHARVFSNASIPDIIEGMRSDVERIARSADVTIVVSKWDLGWSEAGVERVDVTNEMVATFKPNAQVQRWLAGLKDVEPVSLLQALHAD